MTFFEGSKWHIIMAVIILCSKFWMFIVWNISPWSCWSDLIHFFPWIACLCLVPIGHLIISSSDSWESLFSQAGGCAEEKVKRRPCCWSQEISLLGCGHNKTIIYILVSNCAHLWNKSIYPQGLSAIIALLKSRQILSVLWFNCNIPIEVDCLSENISACKELWVLCALFPFNQLLKSPSEAMTCTGSICFG